MEIKIDRDRKGVGEVWGVAGATNCVFERLVETVWSVVVPVASRTLLLEKGLRHMVIQIQFRYSQHTRLQQKERRIGQVGRLAHRKGALSWNVAKQKLRVKLYFTAFAHAHTLYTFSPPLSLCFCVLTQYVCNTPAKPPMGDTQKWGCHFSLPQPEQVNQKCRVHFKI